ncbi:MAG: Holliday junction branch migration DNA helicase RuvB [Rickettsiaceae bacterium]|nr:MAG: Holliday junction branch migration DNA helicase RuvB [Rickettsiaceae bacterium]
MSDNILLSQEQLITDIDQNLRPQYLQQFVGQEQIKGNLSIFIEAAKKRGEQLDHTLFYGPPGLGKTTLAQIISQEMGGGFKSTSGPALSKAADLVTILTNLQTNDVLFIDEIHRLNINIEEVLYPAMEDFEVDIIIGEGPSARSVKIDIPKFTLVGATTRLGLISNPLKDRFGILPRLNFYTIEELKQVLNRASIILETTLSSLGAQEIAGRSRGTPRIALRLLRRIRDFALVEGLAEIDNKIADKALNKLEIDNLGLDGNDLRYLKFVAENYNGGPVGIETIAAALSEQKDTIEETIEPYLIQIGMLQRTLRGRMITPNAFDHLKIPKPVSFKPEPQYDVYNGL